MENLIEELTKVNPANLSEEGLKLFNKINEIIDRNEELKEKEKEHKERIKYLELKIVNQKEQLKLLRNHRLKKYVMSNYISKSKVREMIEEYEEDVKDFEEYWSKDPRRFKRQQSIDYYKLEVLKELLQEGGE